MSIKARLIAADGLELDMTIPQPVTRIYRPLIKPLKLGDPIDPSKVSLELKARVYQYAGGSGEEERVLIYREELEA